MHRRPERLLARDADPVAYLESLPPAWRRAALGMLGEELRDGLERAWDAWAHAGQLAPAGEWSTWVIKAGRGFGKTRAGAEWLTARIAGQAPLKIALVGATLDDARRVMVEGNSGLLAVAGDWIVEWRPSLGRLRFRTGAEAQLFTGHTPHLLRGPEHHYAWCDELAKWECAQECWDMLQLGLRLKAPNGQGPQAVVTTTPGSGPVLSGIIDDPATVVTGGPTSANPHLPKAWQDRIHRLYAGTRLGRQELGGEIIPDAAGALWTVELIEKCRIPPRHGEGSHPQDGEGALSASATDSPSRLREGSGVGESPSLATVPTDPPPTPPASGRGAMTRTLIAVDPPTGDGTCGIIACAREGTGPEAIAHVLADHSVTARSPEGWASAVAATAEAHATIDVVAEQNQGGKMVKAILHAADPRLRIKLVSAHTGKSARAEPVAHLFEAGRAWLHGRMPELEAQMLGMIAGGGYEGPGSSPDRADAMVWGVSELMKERAEPRVRVV